jgi:HlyD family secretion protein
MSQNNMDSVNLTKVESDFTEGDTSVPSIKNKKKNKKKWIISGAVVLVLIVGTLVFQMNRNGAEGQQLSGEYTNYTVENRNITLTLSGTGTLEPADSYTVSTLVSGDILSSSFEEGDIVDKDKLLYELDSSDVSTSIEQAELSLAQSQRSYNQKINSLDDLKIKANENGDVIEILVKAGDNVSAGQDVATIRDSSTMSLVIPFGSDDVDSFYVGQSAEVTIDGSFERLAGNISEISGVEERLDGNMLVRKVTIDVSNPGGIAVDQAATAMIGDIACNGSGTFKYKGESTVVAKVSGEVSKVYIAEGQRVNNNDVLITLSSDTLTNEVENSSDSLRNSQLSLENKYEQLDNYTIKSPISGTIIEKNYKEGDSFESGNVLCTIFDLSYLTMTLNVDELDISKVEAGQEVSITAEALPEKSYKGYVTKVNINGSTSNGVTSYPVTIRIDEIEGLLPGMNVQASIVVSSSKETVAVPVSALSRGNRILVKTDEAIDENSGQLSPLEGFSYVEVTPGISDGEYIEIKEGINEGDVIAYLEETVESSSRTEFMMGPGAAPGQMQPQRNSPGGQMPGNRPRGNGGNN